MNAEDRILDLALREVLGDESPPDLQRRIMHAAQRPRVLRGGRPARRRVAAMACVAALVIVVWGLWPRGDEQALAAWPRDGETGRTLKVPTTIDGPRRIVFAEATTTIAANTRVRIRARGVELEYGRLHVTGPLSVNAGPHVIEFRKLSAGAVSRDESAVVVAIDTGSSLVNDEQQVASGEDLRLALREPSNNEPSHKPPVPPALAPSTKENLERMLSTLGNIGVTPESAMEAEKAASELTFMLRSNAAARLHARPTLHALLQRKNAALDLHCYTLLAFDESSQTFVAEAMPDHAAQFTLDTILFLAEANMRSAVEELKRRLAAQPRQLLSVRPAIYFAMRGDARGRATLEWFLRSRLMATATDLYVAAGASLRVLGEPGWQSAVGYTRRQMERHLARDQTTAAIRRVLVLDYFGRAGTARIAYLSAQLQDHVQQHEAELDTPLRIRARLATIEKR